MYNLTVSDLVLATEYRMGGGIQQPIRDEIGRIWYHDRAWGYPQGFAAWEYDKTQHPGSEVDEYVAYANSLPELIPFIAYMVRNHCGLVPTASSRPAVQPSPAHQFVCRAWVHGAV